MRTFCRLWLLIALLPSSSSADPCTGGGDGDYLGGAGGSPASAADTAVRMVSETVDLVESDSGGSWHVTASYVFANETEREITLSMIFPWEPPDYYCTYAHGGGPDDSEVQSQRRDLEAMNFTVRVDGAEIPATLERSVTCSGGAAYPFGHQFRVTFAPQAIVNLECDYDQLTSPRNRITLPETEAPCPCYGLDFILETGALWKGPIGSITFHYRFAVPTSRFQVANRWPDYDETCTLPPASAGTAEAAGVRFDVATACAANATTVTLTARDAEPTGKVALLFHELDLRRREIVMQGCPAEGTASADCCAYVAAPLQVEPLVREALASPDHVAWRWPDVSGAPDAGPPAPPVPAPDGTTGTVAEAVGPPVAAGGADAVAGSPSGPAGSGCRLSPGETDRKPLASLLLGLLLAGLLAHRGRGR